MKRKIEEVQIDTHQASNTSVDNLASKRVKFNQIVEKAEFEKLSSEEEDEGEEEDFSIDITDEGNKNAISS